MQGTMSPANPLPTADTNRRRLPAAGDGYATEETATLYRMRDLQDIAPCKEQCHPPTRFPPPTRIDAGSPQPGTATLQKKRLPLYKMIGTATMHHLTTAVTLICCCTSLAACYGEHWSRFRGPNGCGVAPHVAFPSSWTDDDWDWTSDVPGRGHSSPVIWEGRLFLQSGDEEGHLRYVLCYDTETGRALVAARPARRAALAPLPQ